MRKSARLEKLRARKSKDADSIAFRIGQKLRKDRGLEYPEGEIIAIDTGESPYLIQWEGSEENEYCCVGEVAVFVTHHVNTVIEVNKLNKDYERRLLLCEEVNKNASMPHESKELTASNEPTASSNHVEEEDKFQTPVKEISQQHPYEKIKGKYRTPFSISSETTIGDENQMNRSLLNEESPAVAMNDISICIDFANMTLGGYWACENCGHDDYAQNGYVRVCMKCFYFLCE